VRQHPKELGIIIQQSMIKISLSGQHMNHDATRRRQFMHDLESIQLVGDMLRGAKSPY
jgi:hypothetical protein